jgi:hypothetical protein
VAVEPGLVWIRTPWRRPLEIEVTQGLLHLEWGEVLLEIPQRLNEVGKEGTGKIFLKKGRAKLHGRGRYRQKFHRLLAGQSLRWNHPDPVYWSSRTTLPDPLKELEEYFLKLEDGQLAEVQAAEPYPITLPRKVKGLVLLQGVGGPTTFPSPHPTSPPTKPPKPTSRPTTRPTPKPTPKPTPPPPTEDPFADPFGDDPFGDDPFED